MAKRKETPMSINANEQTQASDGGRDMPAPEIADVLAAVCADRELRDTIVTASRDVWHGVVGALKRHRAKEAIVAYVIRGVASYRGTRVSRG